MNIDDVEAVATKHKGAVIAGSGAALLLLLFIAHRRAKANAASSTAGSTTQDAGQYLVPYDTSASGADTGGITTGADPADIAALTSAITGLTTSVNNLDPATGATNDGTDGGGGTATLTGHPITAKPQPVHTPKPPTPPTPTHKHKHKPKPVTKTTTGKATHTTRKTAPPPHRRPAKGTKAPDRWRTAPARPHRPLQKQ